MKSVTQIVPENLVKLRKKHNLTQIELSKKINYSDKAISRWEKGEVIPGYDVLEKIADVYGVPLVYFFSEHLTEEEKKFKEREKNLYLLIMLSLILVVWTVAVLAFFVVKNFYNDFVWEIFVWAMPITLYVIRWCQKHFFEDKFFVLTTSFSVWLTIIAIYVQWFSLNLWQLFLFGIPVQLTIVLLYLLKKIKKPVNKKKVSTERIERFLNKDK